MPNFSVQLIKQENAFPSQYSTLKFLNKFQNKKYQDYHSKYLTGKQKTSLNNK